MAKKHYVGIEGTAREGVQIPSGVDGVARSGLKGYVGIAGVARLFFESAFEIVVTDFHDTAATHNSYAVIRPDDGTVVPYGDSVLALREGSTIYMKVTSNTNRRACSIMLNGTTVSKAGVLSLNPQRYHTFCEYTYTVVGPATIQVVIGTDGGDDPYYSAHIYITDNNG